MKTATITFHSSHNYGSMLQAFALQTVIVQMGFENEIINLRTRRQKWMYDYHKNKSHRITGKVLYKILTCYYDQNLSKKHELFERFLQEDLKLTREFTSAKELQDGDMGYDCYVSGGDQIWNTSPVDFDWSFYLPFAKDAKKISYAVSMGPCAEQQVSGLKRIAAYLREYQYISVREEGTKKMVENLIDIPVEINLDPVLLLNEAEWQSHYAQEPILSSDYILVYVPGYNKDVFDLAESIGKLLKYKVVNTVFSLRMVCHPSIHNHYATGPWEFLNLLQHAKMVVSGSYHAVIFSMLYNKPFVALNGMRDNRIRTMLENTGLENRSVSMDEIKKLRESDLLSCDFSRANEFIIRERSKSFDYLRHSILD